MRSVHKQATHLLDICGKAGFRLSSTPQVPTFYSRQGRGSTINLCCSNFLASKLIKSVNTSAKNCGSDHQALIINILAKPETPTKKWIRPTWATIDKNTAKSHLTTQLKPVADCLKSSPANTDDIVTQLLDTVQTHQESLGREVKDAPHRNKSWWCSKTLNPILKERNQARKWMMLTRSEASLELYREWNI
jgi:hypothetical protein